MNISREIPVLLIPQGFTSVFLIWNIIFAVELITMIFAQLSRCELHDITYHDDVIKWKHLPRYWPFVWGIHRSQAKVQWRGALMFTLICARINGWVNYREAGDLRRHRAHYGVTVMTYPTSYDTDQRLLIQSLQQCHKNHIDSVTIIGQFLVADTTLGNR